MGKIKKILENELTGGTQSTEIYPITSIKAVYDENNERLDNIIDRKDKEIQKELEAEVARATNAESNLRETINNITEINENATSANIVTIDTIPNTSSSNVQQALNELFKNTTLQEIIYDVSAHNDGAVFESISALLSSSNLSTFIPTSVRRGGMTIRFIQGSEQSADNKYVQYRLMSDTFNTTESNWQGVDDEPTTGSCNLVKSGGVLTGTVSDILKQHLDTTNIKDTLDAVVLDRELGFDKSKNISAIKATAISYTDSAISQDILSGTEFELKVEDNNGILGNGTIFIYIKVNGGDWSALTSLQKNVIRRWTANANISDIGIATDASNVLASGTVKFSIKYEDLHKAEISKRLEEFSEDNDIANIRGFVSEYGLETYKNNVISAIVGGDMTLPRLKRNFSNSLNHSHFYKVNDEFLNSQGLNIIDGNHKSKSSGEQVEVSRFWYTKNNDICNLIIANKSKYIRLQFYIYSKNEDFPVINNRESAEFYSNKLLAVSAMTILEDTSSPKVKKATFNIPTNKISSSIDYLYLAIRITASNDYNIGEFGYTGLKIGFFESVAEADNKDIIGDWALNNFSFPVKRNYIFSDSFADYLRYGKQGVYFNNVEETRKQIDIFINRYKNKYVDEYNRLLVSFNGDSIFSAQLSFVEDCADKVTGAFPPNMSKKIMARLFYDKYKFNNEDTLFRNITHSDWTKVGFNISNGDNDSTQTFNEIEVYGCTQGDYAQINVSGFHFLKVVWSEYKGLPFSFKVQRSADNGATYTTIDTINVTANDKKMIAYKIYTIENTSINYIYKIEPTSNYSDVCFWGVEMWNNPRLDVVVEAFSGSSAFDNSNHLERFYSDYHKPAIIIMDIYALNDYIYPINNWLEYLSQIYNFIQDKGIPLIAFNTHNPTSYKYPNFSIGTVKVRNIPNVDILSKYKDIHYSSENSIVGSDNLHLNTYGNKYYFKELERIFDDVLLG